MNRLKSSDISAADSLASLKSVGYLTPYEFEQLRSKGYINKNGSISKRGKKFWKRFEKIATMREKVGTL